MPRCCSNPSTTLGSTQYFYFISTQLDCFLDVYTLVNQVISVSYLEKQFKSQCINKFERILPYKCFSCLYRFIFDMNLWAIEFRVSRRRRTCFKVFKSVVSGAARILTYAVINTFCNRLLSSQAWLSYTRYFIQDLVIQASGNTFFG